MAMAAAGAKLPRPYEAVGRDTEVGRALFALYNGYGVARNRGNNYSDRNRMKIMERISARGLPDLYFIPPDPPKPKESPNFIIKDLALKSWEWAGSYCSYIFRVPTSLKRRKGLCMQVCMASNKSYHQVIDDFNLTAWWRLQKPVVRVPQFHKKRFNINDIPQVLLMRGRRKSSQILTQLKEDMLQIDQPPAPKKPLLDEKEKSRLQEIFEWSGRDVEEEEAEAEVPTAPRKPPPARGSVEEQEMLIEAIANEIQERKLFLDRMYELGRGPKYDSIIRLEIQERVRQMELLDKNITRMDKERAANQAHQSARSSNQSGHPSMDEEKPFSKSSFGPLPQSGNRGGKKTPFEEQLDAIRRENMAKKVDQSTKTPQDEDGLSELVEGDESCSEKSFTGHLISSATSDRPGYGNGKCPEIVEARGPESLKSLNQWEEDGASMASPHSTKCSSIRSGSTRSSLKSVKSYSRMRPSALSSPHSTLCM